jgi:MurNAc alpha-1-phosphate uridylyltransferase|tara:strand:- start:1992 stop:2684 length:693 start_codon:yes stop_codon:yes gene_type:complete
MKINTALILCAGYGKRLNPLTLSEPKPLLKIDEVTLLENCINLIESLEINKIIINTFYLKEKIKNFISTKKFNLDIKIIDDGRSILDTGGGILNMINSSNETDFLTFNPDTIWSKDYIKYIQSMEKFYFLQKIKNILLLVNKDYSFDKKLKGDFNLFNNIIKKDTQNNLIYTGCQIINKNLFKSYSVSNFSISKIWNELVVKDELYGYESLENFYHLTNLKIYKDILKNK